MGKLVTCSVSRIRCPLLQLSAVEEIARSDFLPRITASFSGCASGNHEGAEEASKVQKVLKKSVRLVVMTLF